MRELSWTRNASKGFLVSVLCSISPDCEPVLLGNSVDLDEDETA